MSASPHRRRRWPFLLALAAMAAAVAAIIYVVALQAPGDVSNPNVEFNASQRAAQAAPGYHFVWPVYGYDRGRTRYLDSKLAPPFTQSWQWVAGSLIEFVAVRLLLDRFALTAAAKEHLNFTGPLAGLRAELRARAKPAAAKSRSYSACHGGHDSRGVSTHGSAASSATSR